MKKFHTNKIPYSEKEKNVINRNFCAGFGFVSFTFALVEYFNPTQISESRSSLNPINILEKFLHPHWGEKSGSITMLCVGLFFMAYSFLIHLFIQKNAKKGSK